MQLYLTYIVNKYCKTNEYTKDAKTAFVTPVYKKNDKGQIKNYRPVSLLNGFSKVYGSFLHGNLSKFTDQIYSKFISAYLKSNSSIHVLMRSIEKWKASLDKKKLVGTVLMDLYKAFDCISYDLLIRKLYTYGLTTEALTFLYSYLKRRQQGVKIYDAKIIFKILLSGEPYHTIRFHTRPNFI